MCNMNINRKRQSQFELFPGASKNGPEAGKSAHLTKDLTLSLENIIVLCIIFVMSSVLFFSFGVEKGRRVESVPNDSRPDQKTKKANVKSEKPVTGETQEKMVVFPVDIPRELTEVGEPLLQVPGKINDGQERLFTIQVASFKLEKNAQKEADRLKGVGHEDAFVVAKGSYSIVCVGKFSQRDEAKEFSNKLKNKYNDFLVRRL